MVKLNCIVYRHLAEGVCHLSSSEQAAQMLLDHLVITNGPRTEAIGAIYACRSMITKDYSLTSVLAPAVSTNHFTTCVRPPAAAAWRAVSPTLSQASTRAPPSSRSHCRTSRWPRKAASWCGRRPCTPIYLWQVSTHAASDQKLDQL